MFLRTRIYIANFMIFHQRTERWYFRHSKVNKMKNCNHFLQVVEHSSYCFLFVMSHNSDVHEKTVWSLLAYQYVVKDPGFSLMAAYVLSSKTRLGGWPKGMKYKCLTTFIFYSCMIHYAMPLGKWMQVIHWIERLFLALRWLAWLI